jgi:hypothetical protein
MKAIDSTEVKTYIKDQGAYLVGIAEAVMHAVLHARWDT